MDWVFSPVWDALAPTFGSWLQPPFVVLVHYRFMSNIGGFFRISSRPFSTYTWCRFPAFSSTVIKLARLSLCNCDILLTVTAAWHSYELGIYLNTLVVPLRNFTHLHRSRGQCVSSCNPSLKAILNTLFEAQKLSAAWLLLATQRHMLWCTSHDSGDHRICTLASGMICSIIDYSRLVTGSRWFRSTHNIW